MDLSVARTGCGRCGSETWTGFRNRARTTIRYVSQAANCSTVGVGLMFKTPWTTSPYQDDQLNHELMSKARPPVAGSPPTVCRAPMPYDKIPAATTIRKQHRQNVRLAKTLETTEARNAND